MLLENRVFLLSSKEIVEVIEKVLASKFQLDDELANASNSHSEGARSDQKDKDEF